jgi:hypothetical protein
MAGGQLAAELPSSPGRRGDDGIRVPVRVGARSSERSGGAAREPLATESSVMRDAREVAARRKRQLGTGRP